MPTNRKVFLCRYHYDPLDRLVDCTPSAQSNTQRFYQKDRLITEIQGSVQRSIMQHDDQLLAQQQHQSGNVETTLLATDHQRSVLNALDAIQPHPLAYTPYGHRNPKNGLLSLLCFNGERPDPVTGWYLLGNGYRAFDPVLMRFYRPDSWSPFGKGGLNAYAYCGGDPVNRSDPTGHFNIMLKAVMKFLSPVWKQRSTVPTAKSLTKALLPNRITQTKPATPMGLFQKFAGTPHINERIIRSLPGSDMVSLASTSRSMNATVYESALTISGLKKPGTTKEILTEAARGNIEGILPRDAIPVRNFKSVMTQIEVRETSRLIRENNAGYRLPNGRRGAFYITRD